MYPPTRKNLTIQKVCTPSGSTLTLPLSNPRSVPPKIQLSHSTHPILISQLNHENLISNHFTFSYPLQNQKGVTRFVCCDHSQSTWSQLAQDPILMFTFLIETKPIHNSAPREGERSAILFKKQVKFHPQIPTTSLGDEYD